MRYNQGYFPRHRVAPRKDYSTLRMAVAAAVLTLVLILAVNILLYGADVWTVIEKSGQMKPIICDYVLQYGWKPVEHPQSPDPEGWYVSAQRGNTYANFRFNIRQFQDIQVGALIIRIGPWTWYINRG